MRNIKSQSPATNKLFDYSIIAQERTWKFSPEERSRPIDGMAINDQNVIPNVSKLLSFYRRREIAH